MAMVDAAVGNGGLPRVTSVVTSVRRPVNECRMPLTRGGRQLPIALDPIAQLEEQARTRLLGPRATAQRSHGRSRP